MTTSPTLPLLVGYRPAEAEEIARAHGVTITWQETVPPRWLSPHHEPRVGRQRFLADNTVELLRIQVPFAVDDTAR